LKTSDYLPGNDLGQLPPALGLAQGDESERQVQERAMGIGNERLGQIAC
jgi:hypothetical protein